jgi:hypothetical protein
MTQTIFGECVDIVKSLVGNEYLYFDSKIEIKTSPHSFPFAAWAVCVSPKDDLFVMDSDEQWHQVEITDNRAALVIGSLYQRLRLMRTQYAQAS